MDASAGMLASDQDLAHPRLGKIEISRQGRNRSAAIMCCFDFRAVSLSISCSPILSASYTQWRSGLRSYVWTLCDALVTLPLVNVLNKVSASQRLPLRHPSGVQDVNTPSRVCVVIIPYMIYRPMVRSPKQLGTLIHQARVQRGMSQKDLADLIGTYQKTISAWRSSPGRTNRWDPEDSNKQNGLYSLPIREPVGTDFSADHVNSARN